MEEMERLLVKIEKEPSVMMQLPMTRAALYKKIGVERVKEILGAELPTTRRRRRKKDEQPKSPLDRWFRGTWLVEYLKQCTTYRRMAATTEQAEACERAIEKLIPLIRDAWILYCQNIGRMDLEDMWREVYEWSPTQEEGTRRKEDSTTRGERGSSRKQSSRKG